VDGHTCGAPLAAVIENTDTRSGDYAALRDVPRPGHADYPAQVKYGGWQDVAGGGHFSGRLTAPLCIAGGICLQLLRRRGVDIAAHIASVGDIEDEPFDPMGPDAGVLTALRERAFPVLDEARGAVMGECIRACAAEGDSVGGVVECVAIGLPAGIGGPLFGGLESRLSAALFAIPAVKGVEFGAGFGAARLRGSENNDPYAVRGGAVVTGSNHAGGILGGISTGMPLVLRAAFKPTPSIARPQRSVRLSTMEETELTVTGRHDPCIVPRAVPVVEAVTAIVLLDALLGRE
jgi:chorismate synthase